jgi:hypothetical protein
MKYTVVHAPASDVGVMVMLATVAETNTAWPAVPGMASDIPTVALHATPNRTTLIHGRAFAPKFVPASNTVLCLPYAVGTAPPSSGDNAVSS